MKKSILLYGLFVLSFVLAVTWGGGAFSQTKNKMTSDYMTIDKAVAALRVIGAAAPLAINLGTSPALPAGLWPSLYFYSASQAF